MVDRFAGRGVIQGYILYAPDKSDARRGLFAKAAALRELGLSVAFCGEI